MEGGVVFLDEKRIKKVRKLSVEIIKEITDGVYDLMKDKSATDYFRALHECFINTIKMMLDLYVQAYFGFLGIDEEKLKKEVDNKKE